jgi:hypothetical protein
MKNKAAVDKRKLEYKNQMYSKELQNAKKRCVESVKKCKARG